tara:strand:+ start:152 stop:394 length:243 start_codon:yes stop_codon:yes gene_type:complete
MPEVTFRSNNKTVTKTFPYTEKGLKKAKEFAKLVDGKLKVSMKNGKAFLPFKNTPSNIKTTHKGNMKGNQSFRRAIDRAK